MDGYKANEVPIGNYCKDWMKTGSDSWCFLDNGLKAENCSGAIKSIWGEYYYSSHKDICESK